MCHDPDAVNLHYQIIPHSANLTRAARAVRTYKLNHPLPQLWIYLQTDAETFLDAALARDVADVEGHSLNSTSVFSPRRIIPASRNPRARIAPLKLLGHVPDLVPAHCRFRLRHSLILFLADKISAFVFKNGTYKKELPNFTAQQPE